MMYAAMNDWDDLFDTMKEFLEREKWVSPNRSGRPSARSDDNFPFPPVASGKKLSRPQMNQAKEGTESEYFFTSEYAMEKIIGENAEWAKKFTVFCFLSDVFERCFFLARTCCAASKTVSTLMVD